MPESIRHPLCIGCHPNRTQPEVSFGMLRFPSKLAYSKYPLVSRRNEQMRLKVKTFLRDSLEGQFLELADGPTSVDLVPILNEGQFDRAVAEAQQLEESVVVLWMAAWCRKCIYLKPKLEKLAMDYYPRIRFYSIDVNRVPQRLVSRAGITKMPTIQLWRDGKKQDEVIGGHKAWLVVNDTREMIDNHES